MASTSLKRTPTGAGDSNRIFTLSFWFKRASISGAEQYLFECNEAADNNDNFRIIIGSGENLIIQDTEANVSNLDLRTNRLFRDTNAWYHLVLEVDTTQATSSDRAKLYINGVEETSFSTSTYPSQNYDTNVSQSGEPFIIGRRESTATPTSYFDGLMAHYHFVDGTAYDADTFGVEDTDSGIWKPKVAPSVTYGTNGFFLKFQDSSSLGDDSSGNTNDFTLSGTGTQTLDTPSNVFATLNSLAASQSTVTYSLGNTKAQFANSWHGTISTLGASKGKYYWEMKLTGGDTNNFFGVCSDAVASYLHQSNVQDSTTGHVLWEQLGALSVNNTQTTSYFSAKSSGDIFGMALDLDSATKTIQFYKNGSADGSAVNLPSNMQDGLVFPLFVGNSSSVTAIMECNFGNGYFGTTAVASANSDSAGIGKFEYSVPSGYYALCTKNIAEYG